jgi:hypothetical protein
MTLRETHGRMQASLRVFPGGMHQDWIGCHVAEQGDRVSTTATPAIQPCHHELGGRLNSAIPESPILHLFAPSRHGEPVQADATAECGRRFIWESHRHDFRAVSDLAKSPAAPTVHVRQPAAPAKEVPRQPPCEWRQLHRLQKWVTLQHPFEVVAQGVQALDC